MYAVCHRESIVCVGHGFVLQEEHQGLLVRIVDGDGRHAPGSIAFVPSVVGLIIAGEVIKDIAFANAGNI